VDMAYTGLTALQRVIAEPAAQSLLL
jgi:hypothetical protein